MCDKHGKRNQRYGSPFVTVNHVMRGLPPDVRFRRYYREVASGCWEWKGSVDQDGYGIFNATFNGVRHHRAHRFSWAFHTLSGIGKDMEVCHSCDNPRCVNPGHLWLGTTADNQADRWRKGRGKNPKGEGHVDAILTEKQVRAILADPRPQAEIAHDYGVAATTIGSIKQRKSWAHLKDVTVRRNPRGGAGHRRGKSEVMTPEIVREIRASDAAGTELAAKHGVSKQLITAIRKRRAWAHID
jgi:hypothetical protein